MALLLLDVGPPQTPDDGSLMAALGFVSAVVVSLCTGKTAGCGTGLIERAKYPNDFWWGIAIYTLGTVVSIGICLYQAFTNSRTALL